MDDKGDKWHPGSKIGGKYDSPEIVEESMCDNLDFGDKHNEAQRTLLLDLLEKCAKVSPTTNNRLGFRPLIEHRIDSSEAIPIKEPLRHFSYRQQKEKIKQIFKLLDIGVISPQANGQQTSCWSRREMIQ